MDKANARTVICMCKPCGKGPFGSVEEADVHYWSGKHRGKSSVFTRLAGAEKGGTRFNGKSFIDM